MTRALILLLLWMLQMALVLLLADSDWIQRQMRAEQAATAAHFGPAQYGKMRSGAETAYARWFVDTRLVENSYARLLPPLQRDKNDLDVAPWFFSWLEKRLDTFWWLVYDAMYRLQVIEAWGFFLCVLSAAAAVDGLARWKIKSATHKAPSGDRYIIARRALLFLLFAPLFYLSLPLQLPPAAVPAWGCLFAPALILLAANLQHRV